MNAASPYSGAAASHQGAWVVLHLTRPDGELTRVRLSVPQALELIRDLSHSIEEVLTTEPAGTGATKED